MKPILTRQEIRTEMQDYTLENGASALISKTERITDEEANPLLLILATFVIFLSGSYCLVQLFISQKNSSHYEIQSGYQHEQNPARSEPVRHARKIHHQPK